MAGPGERNLEAALEETLGNKLDVPEEVPALLGAYINGQKTIVVNGQPDYVWVRIAGNTSDRTKAFNAHAAGVAPHWELPIIIARDRINPDIWKVQGRDVRRYEQWVQSANLEQSSPYLPAHGSDHSFSSQRGMGSDPVWIFKRQFMPLIPHPAPTGTAAIEIGSDFYYFGGMYHWFQSTGTVDLTPANPTGASNGRFLTIYIDGESGNPRILTGSEFNAVTPPIDPGDFIPVPTTSQGVPVAAVFLLTGSTRIGWGEIYDLRLTNTPVPATGSTMGIYDESTFQGGAQQLNFVGVDLSAVVSGTTAHIIHSPSAATQSGSFRVEELIHEVTLTSPTGSFQVPTISQEYDDLKIILTGRIREARFATGEMEVEFIWNGTTGNYTHTIHHHGGNVLNVLEHANDARAGPIVGRLPNGSSTATGSYGSIELNARRYTETGTIVAHDWEGTYERVNLGFDEIFHQQGAQWFRRYEALASLEIKPQFPDNFETGSKLSIYGIRSRFLPI